MKVVTAEEMRAIEQQMVSGGHALSSLKEQAGLSVANAAEGGRGQILVLVGPGNNGGDGLVAAKHLEVRGRPVAVYAFGRDDPGSYAGKFIASKTDRDGRILSELSSRSDVIVDALLGIGQTRPPDEELTNILRCVNESRRPDAKAFAVDISTGVNADTGAVWNEAFRATETICMGFLKCGSVVYPGAAYSGVRKVAQVGIPEAMADHIRREFPEDPDVASRLPPRSDDSNKGSSGSLMVVAGSADYLGAPVLCSLAAYRTGAGLVNLAVPSSIKGVVAQSAIEAIFTTLPESDGRVSLDAMESVGKALAKAKVMVFGPGLGLSDNTVRVAHETLRLLSDAGKPAVFDADGLNALSQIEKWWQTRAPIVVTPHPGEMSRLTGLTIAEIQSERISTAQRFASEWHAVVVLKGAGTVVASPEGDVSINGTGGPNLATAGTGDVLSGMIGGLLAQGMKPFDAAVAGVYLHGRAGDMLRGELGDVGTVASDLLAVIPKARRGLNYKL